MILVNMGGMVLQQQYQPQLNLSQSQVKYIIYIVSVNHLHMLLNV